MGAGPTGLELAGEISDRWPEKQVTILEPEPEILAGPYKQELRDEVRRQLEERGVEFVLGDAAQRGAGEPAGQLRPLRRLDEAGRTIEADIWFRCYGLAPVSDYLRGELASATAPRRLDRGDPAAPGRRSDERLRARRRRRRRPEDGRPGRSRSRGRRRQHPGPERGRRAQAYEPPPPAIVIPLGPTGGASELPGQDEIAGAEKTAAIKGEHMFVDAYRDDSGSASPSALRATDPFAPARGHPVRPCRPLGWPRRGSWPRPQS